MAYFTPFPQIQYLFTINGVDQLIVLKDIALNVRFNDLMLSKIELFDDYYIKEGSTPEQISELLYGIPEYHWTIMLINGKFDRINDFPIADYLLEEYTYKKYRTSPTDNIMTVIGAPKILYGEILHRENYTGLDCNEGTPFSHQVSNIEYETTLNESKRRIKVINPKLIEQTVEELKASFA